MYRNSCGASCGLPDSVPPLPAPLKSPENVKHSSDCPENVKHSSEDCPPIPSFRALLVAVLHHVPVYKTAQNTLLLGIPAIHLLNLMSSSHSAAIFGSKGIFQNSSMLYRFTGLPDLENPPNPLLVAGMRQFSHKQANNQLRCSP